jgi:uncharacterized protein YcbX
MLTLSEIYIYPIKSLGGISLQTSKIEERGLQYDRRWMLVDTNNKFITQRTFPQMALLGVKLKQYGLKIYHKNQPNENIIIPFYSKGKTTTVTVWNDECITTEVSEEINKWFSDKLKLKCKLVYMPDTTERNVDKKYVNEKKLTGFSDGYPFLIIGQSSLDLLNTKLKQKIPINRFRPNFVFTGGKPHEEDTWEKIKIGNAIFEIVKPCSRCILTTVNQDTGIKGKEPLATLSTYRNFNNKVLFGQNLICNKMENIKAGDAIEVLEKSKINYLH